LSGNTTTQRSDEHNLKSEWPSKYYDKSTRPVLKNGDTLRVTLDVAIGQIVDVVSLRFQ